MTDDTQSRENDARSGALIALVAYTLWGVFPVYFKWIESVAPLEVLAHRVAWAVPFGAVIIAARRQWPDVRRALTHRTMLFWLTISTVCISLNWLIYIWAVQAERIFETSLGYYINPLMFMAVSVMFFGERLRRLQTAAVIFAFIGVSYLTISGGVFPWVALSLAALFTGYGVIRKKIVIGAMPGLFVETTLLLPFAIAWLAYLVSAGQASFAYDGASMSLLLMLGGPITVVPLLLFAIAAKRLTLTAIGFIQFLAPTLQFIVGLYYGEELTPAHVVCFSCIWIAVTLFSIDAIRAGRKKPPQALPAEA